MIQSAAMFQPAVTATATPGKAAVSDQPGGEQGGFAGILDGSQAGRESDAAAKAAGGKETPKTGKSQLSLVRSFSENGEASQTGDATAGSGGKETAQAGEASAKTAAAAKHAVSGTRSDGWGAPGTAVSAAVTAALGQAAAEATSTKAQRETSAAVVGKGSEGSSEGEGEDAGKGVKPDPAASSADAVQLALAGVTVLTAGAAPLHPAATVADDYASAPAEATGATVMGSTEALPAAKPEASSVLAQAPAASNAVNVANAANAYGTALEGVAPEGLKQEAGKIAIPADLQAKQASAKAAYGPLFAAGTARGVSAENGKAQKGSEAGEASAAAATAAGEEPAVVVKSTAGPQQAASVPQWNQGFTASATEGVQMASAQADKIPTQNENPTQNEEQEAASLDASEASGAVASTEGQKASTTTETSEATVAQAAASADKAGQASEAKDFRNMDGAHRGRGRNHEGAQQENSTDEASTEVSGTKSAVDGHAARLTPIEKGGAGQKASADAGNDGGAQQSAQGRDAAQGPNQAMGLQSHAAVELAKSEAPATHAGNGLHQSLLAQVKEGVVTHDGKGNGQMTIRLNPGELGELKIQVRMQDNRVTVEVQADNRMVKDLLMSNLDSLKEALSGKNFSMEGFDVSTGGGGFKESLAQQRSNAQQQAAAPRFGRAGGYDGPVVEAKVNYVTEKANSLLDVRF